jgi:acetyl-CoA C-acetyltransferase
MHLPQRPLGDYTLTGGLTFFGGPGNGYSLHAIAAVVQALRQDGSRPGMVSANGGVMTKQAVGIYSAHPPARDWPGAPATGYIASPQSIGESPAGRGRILSYTRPVVKDAAGDATLLIEMENTQRALAVIDASSAVIDTDLAGRLVNVTAGEKRHHAALC